MFLFFFLLFGWKQSCHSVRSFNLTHCVRFFSSSFFNGLISVDSFSWLGRSLHTLFIRRNKFVLVSIWNKCANWKFISIDCLHTLPTGCDSGGGGGAVDVVLIVCNSTNWKKKHLHQRKWIASERIATTWNGNTMNVLIHGLPKNFYVAIRTIRRVRLSSKSISIV